MIDERHRLLLAKSELLRGLDEPALAAFMQQVTIVELQAANAVIVREGEDAENFYMILTGEAEVLKRESAGGQEFPIATLGPGEHFGETALFEQIKRTATIRTRTPMTLVMLKTRDVRENPQSHCWLPGFLLNLAREGATRLDRRTNLTVQGLRAEADGGRRVVALNRFSSVAIVGLSLYAVSMAFALRSAATAGLGGVLCNGIYVGLGALLIWMMAKREGSLRSFGVRIAEDWRAELRETLVATGLLIALVTGLKLALIQTVPALRGFELITPLDLGFAGIVIVLGYVVFMVLQELCVRGALQSSLEQVFGADPRGAMLAIVVSNALFAALHAHVSPYLAIMTFAAGLVWGKLFARHRSLLGVSISHVVVGLWALRVLGFSEILRGF
ncbi:CAAX amino terminal protease family protein [Enhygromyxa salina]|uniref:CAAX amino terminal protease family protein n=1 Tax=Enhygromyxa salina TaxID=215803 RepID=A0A0C2CKR1_9BACT|nr:cyclic nucleotide-binding domain-containing protein [Enhygromyxa salina]KIG11791.1 CAAX amino terminal protease family protein [Enhygromyxa salina]